MVDGFRGCALEAEGLGEELQVALIVCAEEKNGMSHKE
jgi:hypothetical protein